MIAKLTDLINVHQLIFGSFERHPNGVWCTSSCYPMSITRLPPAIHVDHLAVSGLVPCTNRWVSAAARVAFSVEGSV